MARGVSRPVGPAGPAGSFGAVGPFGFRALAARVTGVVSKPALFIAVIVAVIAFLASAGPVLVASTFGRNLAYDLESSASPFEQQLTSNAVGGPEVGASEDPTASGLSPEVDEIWGAQNDALIALRAGMPSPLRESVEPAQFTTLFPAEDIYSTTGETLRVPQRLVTAFDPRLVDRVRIVDGTAPAAFDAGVGLSPVVIDIVLSTATAGAMEWPIGQTRFLSEGDENSPSFRLSGTFEVNDPNDPYWTHTTGVLEANYAYVGLDGKVLIGQGYADAASWQSARAVMPSAAFSNIWFSLDPAAVNGGNAAEISQQARKFTGVAHQISAAAVDPYNQSVATSLSFTSRLSDFLDLSLSRNAVTLQSFVMLAAGPFGALLATLVLASRLFVRRLHSSVELLAARGATPWQLRGLGASAVLAWALPAAIVGTVSGTILASGSFGLASVVAPVAVSLGAALLVAIAVVPRAGRAEGTGRSLGRLVLELFIGALAAASVIVLLQRGAGGATPRSASSGPPPLDPLLAAEPLLLALLGAVIVVRVYPLLLGRITASARRRPGLTGFLGSAGASRRPPGGPITAVAVLVGVSIAVFSGSLLTTLRTGIEDAAVTTVGADLRVDSPTFGDDEFAAIAGLDGVVDAASVYTATSVIARVGSGRESLSVIVVDTDELRRVQSGEVGAVELPKGLSVTAEDVIPVIVSDQAAALFGSDEVTIGGNNLDVLATVPGEVALSSARTWVLVDSVNAPTLMGLYSAPDRLFASLAETADADAVAAEATKLAGDDATVRTPQKLSRVQQASPNIAALDVAVVLAILLSGVCCALVMVMTLALGASARARLFSILSALGLTRRQAGALTAWEVAPVAVVALFAGTLVGLALPFLVIAGTDLTPFTGGSSQPAIVIDPVLTASIVGAFVLVAVAAVSTFALAVRSARWKKDDA